MKQKEVFDYCLKAFPGTVLNKNWGEWGIFYNPEGKLSRGVYILTIKEKDGDNDKASNVNRPGIYRINLGVRKETFRALFSAIPKRPTAGGIVDMPFDFTVSNTILPHPVYAWMSWICMLSPTEEGFESLRPYIRESYELAIEKYRKKKI